MYTAGCIAHIPVRADLTNTLAPDWNLTVLCLSSQSERRLIQRVITIVQYHDPRDPPEEERTREEVMVRLGGLKDVSHSLTVPCLGAPPFRSPLSEFPIEISSEGHNDPLSGGRGGI